MANRFRAVFPKLHTFLAVVHVQSLYQALCNIAIAVENGADGAFLINHSIGLDTLLHIYRKAKEEFPHFWLGLNMLGVEPLDTLNISGIPMTAVGLWTDNAHIYAYGEAGSARTFLRMRKVRKWEGIYFGGVAFKYQHKEVDVAFAARLATQYVDVITTSGDATGLAPDVEKILLMKEAACDAATDFPLAIASGMTPENVREYMPHADCFLVFTGISVPGTENLDPQRVRGFADAIAHP